MKIIDQGMVASSGGQSAAYAGVCVLPGGRWLCGFRQAPKKSSVLPQDALICFSDDEGANWSRPSASFHASEIGGRAGRFRAAFPTSLGGNEVLAALAWVDVSDPTLPFFNEETQGLLDMKIFLSRSSDGGVTWSEPELALSPFDGPTPLTGAIRVLPDGHWACQFELNKHYYEEEEWRHSSVIMFSGDLGKSWNRHTIASNDPDNKIFYWDQRPEVRPDGEILNLFWTYDNEAGEYLNIHSRHSQHGIHEWSELADTGVPGQPAPPVFLPDGRVAMVYVDRENEPLLKIRTSEDGGQTWPESSEGVLYRLPGASQIEEKTSMQDAWSEMLKYSLGLPDTTLLPDGDVLVVFYAGENSDNTDIRWIRIRLD